MPPGFGWPIPEQLGTSWSQTVCCMTLRNPGPASVIAACVVLLAAALWLVVGVSPQRAASPRLTVLALSPSGNLLAGGSVGGAIRIWDLRKPGHPREISQTTGNLNDLRFDPHERILAIANRNITFVPLAGDKAPQTIRDDEANYGSVRFSLDGRSLLTINGEGAVLVIDISTGVAERGHCCTSIWGEVDFSPDDKLVLWAGHWPGVWDLRLRSLVGRFTANREIMTFGPIASDSKRGLVYMGSQDGRVYQWDLQSRQLLRTSPPLSGYVRTIVLVGNSGWIAYAAGGGPVYLWNPRSGARRHLPAARTTSNLVFDESNDRIALGTESGHVEFWDLTNDRLLERLPAAP